MSADAAANSKLVEEVLSGERPELQELAADGMLPIPPLELLRVQVLLAEGMGGDVGGRAARSLEKAEPRRVAESISEGLDVVVLPWLALNVTHPLVTEAILRRTDAPYSLLEKLGATLNGDLQEILLVRQDAIVERPEILDALESNPDLTSYSHRRITEYRQHLLPTEPEPEPEPPEPKLDPEELISEEEFDAAVEAAKEEPAVGEVDEITGLSESQLRTLPLPARLKLSRRAPKALRSILIRDMNPTVAVSVLENNPMSESEIEQVARNRAVVDDVLVAIAKKRTWTRKYGIVLALVKNPRTPAGISIRFASRLSVRDLRDIAKDRNVANSVRSNAERLYKLKLA